MTEETYELMRNEITRLHKVCREYQLKIETLTERQIDFDFRLYTKQELAEFCLGEDAKYDVAIPLPVMKQIRELTGTMNGHLWYVMDYTDNIHGTLVNLKEAFFERIANQCKYLEP